MAGDAPGGGVETERDLDALRADALAAVRRYAEEAFAEREFIPGETNVPVGGRVIGPPELEALADASLDGWLTEGRFAREFTAEFAKVVNRSQSFLVGSGSQANLLAVAATTSHLHERPLKPGDEVITPALGFSTTVGPLYQYGLVPVYVDVELDTFNPTVDAIAAAVSDRTRAILIAHCLGNPFDVEAVAELCREHDLVLIEDCCDALGSHWAGRPVGSFGEAATFSFYPAHHMTTGESGAVVADDPTWLRAIGSLREWGRDCWCPPGVNDACGKRFDGRFGELPAGFDHKYVFSHVGFNFKVTDMQASLGIAQLERLEGFGARRRENFERLQAALTPLEDKLVLPRALPEADPSWFGYPFTLRHGSPDDRRDLQRFLLERKIDNRLMLGGNLTRQPGFLGREHRIPGPLDNADRVMDASLWVGCYPGLSDEMVDWIAESITAFVSSRT